MYNKKIVSFSLICFFFISVQAQVSFQKLGLENKNVSSIGYYDGILAVGTIGNGVYCRNTIIDTNWSFLGLDSAEVHTVYPHKSGPLGWAIGAGLNPDSCYPHFIYCSYMGNSFNVLDRGITDTLANIIHELDGFPDPTVCGETYAAAGGALLRRNFNDTVWIPIYSTTDEGYVRTVKSHNDYPGVVMVGGSEGIAGRLLLKSLDFGDSWEWLSPPEYIVDIDFAGDSAQTIFLVAGNVYRSLDAGNSWDEIFNTGGIWIKKVIYQPNSSIIWIGGSDDVFSGNSVLFYSRDLGLNWQQVLLNIQNPVIDMELAQDGWLYIATPDSGIFRLDTDFITSIKEKGISKPQDFILEQNYPNPFNPTTNISYYLAGISKVKIIIYNLDGHKVRTLVDGQKGGGFYNVQWDGKNDNGNQVATGIYIYRFEARDFIKSQKMILMK